MNEVVSWLEAHEKLAGWAQFLGAMLAIGLTAWLARGDARARKEDQVARAKALLYPAAHLHSIVVTLEVLAGPASFWDASDMCKRTAIDAAKTVDSFAADSHTSTFMINNARAVRGHADMLLSQIEKSPRGPSMDMIESLKLQRIGLSAICSNVGKEVMRLGGRGELHDDRKVREWLKPRLAVRLSDFLKSLDRSARRRRLGLKDKKASVT